VRPTLSALFGWTSPESFASRKLPGLWLALAAALLPILEFLSRGWLNGPLGLSLVTACWLGGTAAVILASGTVAADTRPGKWLAFFILASIASALVNGRTLLSLPSLTLLGAGLAVFLLSSSSLPAITGERLSAGLAAGGALASLFALQQKFGGLAALSAQASGIMADPVMAENIRNRLAEPRAFGFFLYPNALAGFLLLSVPPVYLRFQEAWKAGRIGAGTSYGLLAALLVAGLYSTGSMGAVTALFLALGLAVFLRRSSPQFKLALLGAAVVLAGAVFYVRPSSAFSGGLESKGKIWSASVAGWRGTASLLAGTGPGSFGETVGVKLDVHARSRYAHNWLVETWVETGLAGLLALGGFIFLLFSSFVYAVRAKGARDWGLWVGWLALLIHMMGDVDYILPSVVLPWFAVSGLLARNAPSKAGKGRTIRVRPAIPGYAAVTALFASTLFQGAWSSLFLGLVLGSATAYLLWKSLSGTGIRGLAGAGDAPLLFLGFSGMLWLFNTCSLAGTWPVVMEGAGLMALALAVRGFSGSGARFPLVAARTVAVFALVHGGWAVIEGLATGGPAFTSFPSPNFLGAFLVAGLGLSAWKYFDSTGRERILFNAAALASFAGVIATRSSGAGLAAGALVVIMAIRRGMVPGVNRFRWWSASLGLALLMVIVAVPPISPVSIHQRLNIWREGGLALAENPLGVGPGNYRLAVAPVRLPSYTFSGLARYSLRADFAHCEPLQAAVEWGLPALGLLIWAGWCVFSSMAGFNSGWGFALLGLLLHGLVDFPFRAPPLEIFSAIAFGVITASSGRRPGPVSARPRPLVRTTLLAVLVSLLAGLGVARHGLARFTAQVIQPRMPVQLRSSANVFCLEPVMAGAYLAEANSYFDAVPGAGSREFRDYLVRRGREIQEIAMSLSGDDSDSRFSAPFFYPMHLPARNLAAAVRETDIVSFPRNLLFQRALLARIAEPDGRRQVDAELAGVSAIEPFYLSVYLYRGKLAEMKGDNRRARRLYLRALLLSHEAGKRRGLNEYEKNLVEINPAELDAGLRRVK